MNANERRRAIIQTLIKDTAPISAKTLGEQYNVSRQVIVQDIAAIRKGGIYVIATNRGYMVQQQKSNTVQDFAKTILPIGVVRTDLKEKFGIPRQSGRVQNLTGKVVLYKPYQTADAFRGIEGFSYLWVLFGFSAVEQSETFQPTVRPPRLGGNQKVGVFASRSPFRPNGLGLSCVKLLRVEITKNEGVILHIAGVDMLDGTPVYDIKPYVPHADCRPNASGGYADRQEGYRLQVDCDPALLQSVPKEKQTALIGCLAEDPRPAYIEKDDRIYGMRFMDFNVKFKVCGNILTVIAVE